MVTSRKKYHAPDDLIADGQKKTLLKTARDHKGNWGIEVIGCLEGISELVAKANNVSFALQSSFRDGWMLFQD